MACQCFLNLMLKYVIWKAAFNVDVGYTALFAVVLFYLCMNSMVLTN